MGEKRQEKAQKGKTKRFEPVLSRYFANFASCIPKETALVQRSLSISTSLLKFFAAVSIVGFRVDERGFI